MHELGMCEALVDAVERRAAGRPVGTARVRVGTMHGLDPDAFAMAFALVAEGTGAEGTDLDVVVIPAEATCRTCGVHAEPDRHLPLCPACGSADLDVTSGDTLVLESITLRAAPYSTGGPAAS